MRNNSSAIAMAAFVLVLGACSKGRDPMARQPDPETHPGAVNTQAGSADTGAPITSPEQGPDSPPNEDASAQAMPPPDNTD
jgi:hypothetical protein